MTKKINVFQILLITIIASFATIYITRSYNSTNFEFDNKQVIINIKSNALEATLGNLFFLHDSTTQILNEENNYLLLKMIKGHVGKDKNNVIKRDYNFSTAFYFLKNANPNKLSAEKYYLENAPSNERQAPTPEIEERVSINGYEAYRFIYTNGSAAELGSSYYDVVMYYIPHGTDMYEIEGYKLPTTPSSDLTPTDIAAARAYESAFAEILNSIEFKDTAKSPTSVPSTNNIQPQPQAKPELM